MEQPLSSQESTRTVRVAGWQVLVMAVMVAGVGFSFYKAGTGSDYFVDQASASAPAQVAEQ